MKTLLSVFLILTSSMAMASTRAYFADSCSGKEIVISTPNKTSLFLSINQLNSDEDLKVFIKFRPAGIIEDLKDKKLEITHSYSIPASRFRGKTFSGFFKIPKAKWMWQKEQEHNLSRIWDAEIKWTQPSSRKTGSQITSFFRSQGEKTFYRVNSHALCHWEGLPEVTSKLYENNTNSFMNVIKSSYLDWDKYTQRGLTFGYNRNHGGNFPIGSSDNSYGWFYKDWQKQVNSQETVSIELKFILNKDEAGVFYKRRNFTRIRASRYEWNQESSLCGQYEKVSDGLLDVGVETEDFIVLPRTYYPFPEKMTEFIGLVRPSINTCTEDIQQGPMSANDTVPTGLNGIMFYYENN